MNILLELGRLEKWKNHEIKYTFVHFFPEIAKINTCEIQLPNFREIKYAQKLVRIRYTDYLALVKKHLKVSIRTYS